jgi:hypothetical protein
LSLVPIARRPEPALTDGELQQRLRLILVQMRDRERAGAKNRAFGRREFAAVVPEDDRPIAEERELGPRLEEFAS